MIHPFNEWAKWRPGISIPVFFLSLFFSTQGQSFYPDVRSLALGNISSVPFSENLVSENPATLSWHKMSTFIAGHASPFLIKEIGISSLEGLLPVYPGAFQIQISSFGIKNYRNLLWKIAYGMSLSERLSAGVSFQFYQTISNRDWAYLWTLGIGSGICYKLSDRSILGLHIVNPITIGNYADYGQLFPSFLKAGLSHEIYEKVKLFGEISQSSFGYTQSKIGLDYTIGSDLKVSTGYHSKPHTLSFGSTIKFGRYIFHLACSWSSMPGFSPAIQIQYKPIK